MSEQALFPHWLEGALVSDAAFGRAYAALPDARRALLKTAIARLWEWSGPSEALASRQETLLRSGLRACVRTTPRPFAALLFDPGQRSAARLLAALTPALAAGIPEVLAVRVGGRGNPPAPLLTALELAGVERLALLSRKRAALLLEHLAQAGQPGLLLALGQESAALAAEAARQCPALGLWTAPPCAAGVWLDRVRDLDLAALAFAQEGATVHVWGPGGRSLPDDFVRQSGTFDAFLRQGYQVVFLPATRRDAGLERAAVVLGPECESCWLWPGLEPAAFLRRQVCFQMER